MSKIKPTSPLLPTDLVKRLRQSVARGYKPMVELTLEAADEIERLQVEIQQLRAGLK